MGYIGRSVDKISNIETLDNITFDGSSSYSLTKNSVGFSPSASQNILISIDGVVQSGNFTVSGSTIDFGVAISSSSVCNFIIHLGVGLVTSPSDGSVGTSQLASTAVTTAKIADDAVTKDKLLSHNYPAFEAYLSANQSISNSVDTKLQANTETFDTDSCYDNSTNYRFTPTVAGKYFVYGEITVAASGASLLAVSRMFIRKNGNSLTRLQTNFSNNYVSSHTESTSAIVDMNGSSDYLELFGRGEITSGTANFIGDSSLRRSYFGAYRIGD